MFFNDPATTEIYTLSLHDALPISARARQLWNEIKDEQVRDMLLSIRTRAASLQQAQLNNFQRWPTLEMYRSEEHTSELQSQSNLVCRLLLEKKKKITTSHKYRTAL